MGRPGAVRGRRLGLPAAVAPAHGGVGGCVGSPRTGRGLPSEPDDTGRSTSGACGLRGHERRGEGRPRPRGASPSRGAWRIAQRRPARRIRRRLGFKRHRSPEGGLRAERPSGRGARDLTGSDGQGRSARKSAAGDRGAAGRAREGQAGLERAARAVRAPDAGSASDPHLRDVHVSGAPRGHRRLCSLEQARRRRLWRGLPWRPEEPHARRRQAPHSQQHAGPRGALAGGRRSVEGAPPAPRAPPRRVPRARVHRLRAHGGGEPAGRALPGRQWARAPRVAGPSPDRGGDGDRPPRAPSGAAAADPAPRLQAGQRAARRAPHRKARGRRPRADRPRARPREVARR
mmetsp:Transcript_11741/g.27882  ORF Transcript_11741/g.27882 Transcript_11741/m.27882 type:complete len:345 (+) Transcript_11741:551-1585(+)